MYHVPSGYERWSLWKILYHFWALAAFPLLFSCLFSAIHLHKLQTGDLLCSLISLVLSTPCEGLSFQTPSFIIICPRNVCSIFLTLKINVLLRCHFKSLRLHAFYPRKCHNLSLEPHFLIHQYFFFAIRGEIAEHLLLFKWMDTT